MTVRLRYAYDRWANFYYWLHIDEIILELYSRKKFEQHFNLIFRTFNIKWNRYTCVYILLSLICPYPTFFFYLATGMCTQFHHGRVNDSVKRLYTKQVKKTTNMFGKDKTQYNLKHPYDRCNILKEPKFLDSLRITSIEW